MRIAAILIVSASLFMTASAQALQPEVLYGFQLGARTPSTLVQGDDGKFYGTTWYGRSGGYGKVFTVTMNGVLTWLASFTGDSDNLVTPVTGLVLGRDGHFYGTTPDGGGNRNGTVFRVTTNGALTTLVSFSGTNGAHPGRLVLGNDGNFYGTTSGWGGSGNGTVFKVTTTGALTTLVSFSYTNGANPEAELALGNDGDFYGTTAYGGSNGVGTVFKVTTNGVLTSLVSFTGDNGAVPRDRLVLGADGDFYGTTTQRGSGISFGTVFKVTTNGVLTTLVSFNSTNGVAPGARLVLGKDGDLYGTTSEGGDSGYGTVFRLTPNGVFTTLASFNGTNGANPEAGLVLGSDGYFYSTTANGGPGGGNTIFRLVISPKFTSVARQPGGTMLLTGTGLPNEGYRLWTSADLSSPVASWTLLTSASFDSNGNFSYTDAGAITNPSRFYQLSVP